MRTTLNLDDDVLSAVKELARIRRMTAGQVLSSLAREALRKDRGQEPVRNGVPLLLRTEDEGIVTPEIVNGLRDDE